MEFFVGICILIVFLFLMPFLWGRAFFGRGAEAYCGGVLLFLALFQLVGMPFVLFSGSMGQLAISVDVICVLVSLAAAVRLRGELKSLGGNCIAHIGNWLLNAADRFLKKELQEKLLWLAVLLLGAVQLFQAITLSTFDGDDAYYVAQSVAAAQRGELYRVIPYTGFATELDLRHAMAVFPIWIAYLSVSSGIHAAILAHSLLPLFLFPLSWCFYYLLGKTIFSGSPEGKGPGPYIPGKTEKLLLPGFMLLLLLARAFWGVSIFTGATFMLTRTWQGKAVLSGILLPALFWLLFRVGREKLSLKTGSLIFLTNICAALATGMGIFLSALLVGGTGLFLAIYHRSLRLLFLLALCCLPCIVYGALYFLL